MGDQADATSFVNVAGRDRLSFNSELKRRFPQLTDADFKELEADKNRIFKIQDKVKRDAELSDFYITLSRAYSKKFDNQ